MKRTVHVRDNSRTRNVIFSSFIRALRNRFIVIGRRHLKFQICISSIGSIIFDVSFINRLLNFPFQFCTFVALVSSGFVGAFALLLKSSTFNWSRLRSNLINISTQRSKFGVGNNFHCVSSVGISELKFPYTWPYTGLPMERTAEETKALQQVLGSSLFAWKRLKVERCSFLIDQFFFSIISRRESLWQPQWKGW